MGTSALSLPGYTEVLGEVPRVTGLHTVSSPHSSPSFPADTPLRIMYQVAMIPKHQCIKGVCSLVHHGMRKIRTMEQDSYKAKLIPYKGKLLLTFLLKLSDGFQRHLE